jgi:hypothetical protein
MLSLDHARHPDDFGSAFAGFHQLLPHRVQDLLLVCSLYESFILEEDGLLADLITSEYLELNLSHAPRVSRASTGREALDLIARHPFDLVITMSRLSGWDVQKFAEAVKELRPELPVIVLADEPRELARYGDHRPHRGPIDQIFVWHGDAKILLAIIKYVEDWLNAEHDTRVGNVRVIILIENSVRFYSSYLPLIYTELMKQTQVLMAEGINRVQKLLRMRARPKILLAENFEDAWELYTRYSDYLLGIISDVRFPWNGVLDASAGVEFIQRVKVKTPHMPVLLQSSEAENQAKAAALGACFVHKKSRTLLQDVRHFIQSNLGFGDFVFRMLDGTEVGRAGDLRTLVEVLAQVPEASILFHAGSNHFSNWLMARTEFELAARIRPRTIADFASAAELRRYLIETLTEFDERSQTGIISDFSRHKFSTATAFTRIGGGSIGGKARGLAFISALLKRQNVRNSFPRVRIAVPNSAAIGTDVFDAFLEENHLLELVARDAADEQIAQTFLEAKLPALIHSDLAAFLSSVRYPLAVRSSSLLEDSHGQPFAGVYRTSMIPNNHFNLGIRLDQLCQAIKLVYASTFTRLARRHLEITGHRTEEEKMGVILQELVGAQYGDHFYPSFSGVVRSYNYYPFGQLKPADGVACVALGLGKMVVEGGEFLMFSPAHPHVLPQFASTRDLLANSQRNFYALDMSRPEAYPTSDVDANLLTYGLDVAERDGTLAAVGSVYSRENDAVYDGIIRPGPRLVTFAHVLKSDIFPLADIVRLLLDIGQNGMACPIEIEFAVNLHAQPMEFGFLQIRPTIADEASEGVALGELHPADTICYSAQALGNGRIRGIHDLVVVEPARFDSARTREIAAEIGHVNEKLRAAGRPYVLIGPGRWGSADPWLGIPVVWEQISAAQVIVETSLHDFVITPSQGTHFFQNLTSFRIGYLTVNPTVGEGHVDWDWLARQPAVEETAYLRHVRLEAPLEVRLDGRSRRGAILKPNAHSATDE